MQILLRQLICLRIFSSRSHKGFFLVIHKTPLFASNADFNSISSAWEKCRFSGSQYSIYLLKSAYAGGDGRKMELETCGTRDDKSPAVAVSPIGVLRITRI